MVSFYLHLLAKSSPRPRLVRLLTNHTVAVTAIPPHHPHQLHL